MIILTPKQMHLVSDQNNQRTTFPVRRSAHGPPDIIRGAAARPVTRLLLHSDDTRQARCLLRSPHFVPRDPARNMYIVPACKRRRVASLDACVSERTECVIFSHPSQHRRTAELRVCALWQGTTRSHQTDGLPRHFCCVINGF